MAAVESGMAECMHLFMNGQDSQRWHTGSREDGHHTKASPRAARTRLETAAVLANRPDPEQKCRAIKAAAARVKTTATAKKVACTGGGMYLYVF